MQEHNQAELTMNLDRMKLYLKEGRKDGRKEKRKKGRKEGRKIIHHL